MTLKPCSGEPDSGSERPPVSHLDSVSVGLSYTCGDRDVLPGRQIEEKRRPEAVAVVFVRLLPYPPAGTPKHGVGVVTLAPDNGEQGDTRRVDLRLESRPFQVFPYVVFQRGIDFQYCLCGPQEEEEERCVFLCVKRMCFGRTVTGLVGMKLHTKHIHKKSVNGIDTA
ncbi:hypothetical protein NHX12_028751 [Muraenolepis orangiensis]|uniref:Uncharacterized protein n=1 Tax=Muraenolepis orangiensis TaxID=630683 RepID=A0A9Q0EEM2_9TELE|nr:hypothetical protein NHX12_028751 [Muraenolepis orangiensis]